MHLCDGIAHSVICAGAPGHDEQRNEQISSNSFDLQHLSSAEDVSGHFA